ncbi:MAG: OmpA family protein [Enterobacteriaceae bacterium]|jgi:outer membrane protein OmpA-like peptidoglycan-associated protein|nr:OmpA family protein [Enterobacteriaceae bacterium]
MRDISRCLLTVLSIILALWLLLGFWQLSSGNRITLSLIVLIIGGVVLWRQWCHRRTRHHALNRFSSDTLPPEDFQGAVVLVAGDSAQWFTSGQPFRETTQGWYLQAENAEQLPQLAEQLAAVRPALVPQVVVLLTILPESYTAPEVFQQSLRTWQRAIVQCRSWLNGLPPVLITVLVTPPSDNASDEPLWFAVTPNLSGTQVRLKGSGAMPVADWLRESSAADRFVRLNQTLWLNAMQDWYTRTAAAQMNTRQGELPALLPAALGFCLAPVEAVNDNLWQQHVAAQTALFPPVGHAQTLLPLPEVLLSSLSRRRGVSRRMQIWRNAGLIFGAFLLLAMLASFLNNQRLLRSTGDHLSLYHRLDGHPPEPKVQAQQRLRADSRLLDDWQRRGEPLRYGLGLYQGMRLIAPVEAAISGWAPPPPPPPVIKKVVQGPKTVRLDSLSLFESGKSALRSDSTKVLVNALVGIKAKPGWLIVVSGHSDNTGNPQLNQVLSQKRAESVRDWMRDTGDMPESCFAVQGYGESRPVATNDTPEGRELNRRVEISLVPQANACQIPGVTSVSSQDDDASDNKME